MSVLNCWTFFLRWLKEIYQRMGLDNCFYPTVVKVSMQETLIFQCFSSLLKLFFLYIVSCAFHWFGFWCLVMNVTGLAIGFEVVLYWISVMDLSHIEIWIVHCLVKGCQQGNVELTRYKFRAWPDYLVGHAGLVLYWWQSLSVITTSSLNGHTSGVIKYRPTSLCLKAFGYFNSSMFYYHVNIAMD